MVFNLRKRKKNSDAMLVSAARVGDTSTVKQLLNQGADIDMQESESGDTPLLAALDEEQWSTVDYLLAQGADLTLADIHGQTPLFLAASCDKNVALVKLLLDAGAPVDLSPAEMNGSTPLQLCCANGANQCVELLLDYGATVSASQSNGTTALHLAAKGGDEQTVQLLCAAGANMSAQDDRGHTPLHASNVSGNVAVTIALLQQGAQIDALDTEGATPLMLAAIHNQAETARILLEHGANPEIAVSHEGTPIWPLYVAAINGYDDVVQILLEYGADVEAKSSRRGSPLDVARENGHHVSAELIALEMEKEARSERGETTRRQMNRQNAKKDVAGLWQEILSAIRTDRDQLQDLVQDVAFPALSTGARLLVACVLEDTEAVRDMLEAGADPNESWAELADSTPLMIAANITSSSEIGSLLIDAGAEVDKVSNSTGATAIFEVTFDARYDMAELLVSKGANVNFRLSNGLTPLIYASSHGALRCTDLLLDAGADINAVEAEQGIGAFGIALNFLHVELAEHLLARGAEPNFGSVDTLPLAIAEYGSLAFVQALVAQGCALVRDNQRSQMAFVSARNPDPEVFDYLLNHGADPGSGSNLGYTALTLAALHNHHGLVRRYLERGDDAAARDIDGETALSLAIEKRHDESVAVLREFHVEESDYSALTPEAAMLRAAEDGMLGSILNLRDMGVPINGCDQNGNTALMLSVRAGHHGVVRSLYHLGADINHRNKAGETAFALATDLEFSGIAKSLREFGVQDVKKGDLAESPLFSNVPVFDSTDVMFGRMSHPYKEDPPYVDEADDWDEQAGSVDDEHADYRSNEEIEVEDEDLDKDNTDDSESILDYHQLCLAVQMGMVDTFSKQISEGFDVNYVEDGITLLMMALLTLSKNDMTSRRQERNIEQIIDMLLTAGADPNLGSHPALFFATMTGRLHLVNAILRAGADIDAVTELNLDGKKNQHWTALTTSLSVDKPDYDKDEQISLALLKAGPDLSFSFSNGSMAVHIAASRDKSISLSRILDLAPEMLNAQDGKGRTPLMRAAANGQINAIKVLLERGAGLDLKDANGYTAAQIAQEAGHELTWT